MNTNGPAVGGDAMRSDLAAAIEHCISGAMIDNDKRPSDYKAGIVKGLEEALRLARKYEADNLQSLTSRQSAGAVVDDAMVERALSAYYCHGISWDDMRAALVAALEVGEP